MECLHEDAEGVRIIRLAGRMDIEGNDEIALRFNTLAVTGGPSIIVDLSGVEFLGSIGIGTLVTGAKTVKLRQGVLVLCGARSNVLGALQRTNIPGLIPTVGTLDEARVRVVSSREH
jgi:anti-sigma B factor antagonist